MVSPSTWHGYTMRVQYTRGSCVTIGSKRTGYQMRKRVIRSEVYFVEHRERRDSSSMIKIIITIVGKEDFSLIVNSGKRVQTSA